MSMQQCQSIRKQEQKSNRLVLNLTSIENVCLKGEYDQEMPQSHNADQPTAR